MNVMKTWLISQEPYHVANMNKQKGETQELNSTIIIFMRIYLTSFAEFKEILTRRKGE